MKTSFSQNFGSYAYLRHDGVNFHAGFYDYSAYFEYGVSALEYHARSDRRSKDVLGLSDTKSDLDTILKLRVTDYRRIDSIAEGTNVHKGFIAQEVEAIIPEAISKGPAFVPDIYERAASVQFDSQSKSLNITLDKKHGLKVGDRVRFITAKESLELPVARIPTLTSLEVLWDQSAPEWIFVYGKEVSDFRTVNYDRIFTTGIGAIQQLSKVVTEKDTEIRDLKQRVSALEKLVKTLAEMRDTTEREAAGGGQ